VIITVTALLLWFLQVVYEIPAPGPTARLEMLKYHGRNKPVEDEGLYYKVAEVTAGWSAAALANLMNEAAILTVSYVTCYFKCYP
jgi:cell division protease FtsH